MLSDLHVRPDPEKGCSCHGKTSAFDMLCMQTKAEDYGQKNSVQSMKLQLRRWLVSLYNSLSAVKRQLGREISMQCCPHAIEIFVCELSTFLPSTQGLVSWLHLHIKRLSM